MDGKLEVLRFATALRRREYGFPIHQRRVQGCAFRTLTQQERRIQHQGCVGIRFVQQRLNPDVPHMCFGNANQGNAAEQAGETEKILILQPAAGGKAVVKIGNDKLEGTVSSVTPLSKNGVISFTVQLKDDNNHRLRSGLKTDVYVMNAVKEDVMRMANASFYVGRGEYDLFVRTSDDELVKRKVQLGDSNFEYVEVVSGLQLGDVVVVSDMSSYKNKNKLKMR